MRRVVWPLSIIAGLAALAGLLALSFPGVRPLAAYALYSVPSNSVVPLPNEPALWVVQSLHKISPVWLGLAGALGAGAAAMLDYQLIRSTFGHPRIDALRDRRLFRWAIRAFSWAPLATVTAFAALPLPISVVRIVAPASGYARHRYMAGIFAGRWIRYGLLAWLGAGWMLPRWTLIPVVAVIAIGAIGAPLAAFLRSRRQATRAASAAGPVTASAPASAEPLSAGPASAEPLSAEPPSAPASVAPAEIRRAA